MCTAPSALCPASATVASPKGIDRYGYIIEYGNIIEEKLSRKKKNTFEPGECMASSGTDPLWKHA